MLSFTSLDQATANFPEVNEQQGSLSWTTLGLWCLWAILYHLVMFSVVGSSTDENGKKKNDQQRRAGMKKMFSFRRSGRSFAQQVCPRRAARWYKCAKRCEKQCEKTTPMEECCFTKCAMNLVKLHLPPPLPLKKPKKKNKRERSSSSSQDNCSSSSSSSCCTEATPCCEESSSSSSTTTSLLLESSSHQDKTRSTADSSASTVPPPSPPRPLQPAVPLIDLARMQYWQLVLEQTTRRGAKYRDCDGLYPLHWACSAGPPATVVQALLDAYPSAARKVDKEGSTALHFCTHYSASAAVVQALLTTHPRAASVPDRYGRTPLLHAVEKSAGMDVLEQLVAVDPTVITLPCLPEEQRQVLPMTRGIAQRTPLYMAWSAVLLDRKARTSQRGKRWEKALFLLQSAYKHTRQIKYGNTSTTMSSTFLSAAIEMDIFLPAEVISMAVKAHPHEVHMVDEVTGRSPLLQAAAAPLVSRQRSDEIIQLLLEHSQPSAVFARDAEGKAALHLALEAGKPWLAGVQRLLQANPAAIYWRDQAGLTPALAAATVSNCIADDDEAATGTSEVDENPLGFLSPKYKEIMRRRRLQLLKPLVGEHKITCTEQVSTILDVLRADPSVLLTPARK